MKSNREKIVIKTSIISILSNIMLAIFKAFIGLISNSIAIITDSINNLSDALSSIITIVGTKLATKSPDKKHPYGYGRVEYLTSFIVSAIVLYAGITALTESIKKIINPEKVEYSINAFIIVIIGIIVKFVLGLYVKKKGKEVKSSSLVASGLDAYNDAILSISVLLSAIIYIIFHINIESYIGILLSIVIIKSGIDLIKESVDNILGVRVESKLSSNIKKEVTKEKNVKGAFDLVLNNYGPDIYTGSIHIELDDDLKVSEVDKISRNITRNVMKKYGVMLHTIGIYSVNTKDKNILKVQKEISKIVFSNKEILQMHGFYVDEENKIISFDVIIDFNAKNREEIYKKIYEEINEKYKNYTINITLDIDTSD